MITYSGHLPGTCHSYKSFICNLSFKMPKKPYEVDTTLISQEQRHK